MRRFATGFRFGMGFLVAMLLLVTSCSADVRTERFGSVVSPLDDIVGSELAENRVVSLPCIPSRRDPVGVWVGLRVIESDLSVPDSLRISVEMTDARLGSHPSGCRDPVVLAAQSMFLITADDQTVLARSQELDDGVTTLEFGLEGNELDDVDLVILPTIEFERKDGQRETTIFGLMGRYSLGEPPSD